MANRNRTDAATIHMQGDTTSPTKFLLSSTNPQSNEKNDDLIVTLSDAYENRRARQVVEWEKLYGQNVYRAV
ncbi:MAG TPA: hypothetical protein VFZ23_04000 [Pyrinomonadaceae bacterium]